MGGVANCADGIFAEDDIFERVGLGGAPAKPADSSMVGSCSIGTATVTKLSDAGEGLFLETMLADSEILEIGEEVLDETKVSGGFSIADSVYAVDEAWARFNDGVGEELRVIG